MKWTGFPSALEKPELYCFQQSPCGIFGWRNLRGPSCQASSALKLSCDLGQITSRLRPLPVPPWIRSSLKWWCSDKQPALTGGRPLAGSVCPFPWCQYSHCCWFQASGLTWLDVWLGWCLKPPWASSSFTTAPEIPSSSRISSLWMYWLSEKE